MTEQTASVLDKKLPLRTAGALPSSRTEDMVLRALESDDIDAVKAELVHTALHYQSLEYTLNGLAADPSLFREGIEAEGLEGEDPIDVVVRVIATHGIDAAYDKAHGTLFFLQLGIPHTEALRVVYSELDHSDPERELSQEDLDGLSGQTADEDEDEGE